MKKFLKPLALFLAFALICQIFTLCLVALEKTGTCGQNARYSLDTDTGEFDLYGIGKTYDYKKFTVMKMRGAGNTDNNDGYTDGDWTGQSNNCVPWQQDAHLITSVTIGEKITKLGSNLFSQCNNISEITFLSPNTEISSSAFDLSASYVINLYHNSTADRYFTGSNFTKKYISDKGDVNSDGEIDINDAVLLAQFLAEWPVTVDEYAADCNADGSVSIDDAVLLAQFLAEWPVTLG